MEWWNETSSSPSSSSSQSKQKQLIAYPKAMSPNRMVAQFSNLTEVMMPNANVSDSMVDSC
jgi:hypothetical protein